MNLDNEKGHIYSPQLGGLDGLQNWPTVSKLSGHAPNLNACPQNCAIHVFVKNITYSTKVLYALAPDQVGTKDPKLNKTKVWAPFPKST